MIIQSIEEISALRHARRSAIFPLVNRRWRRVFNQPSPVWAHTSMCAWQDGPFRGGGNAGARTLKRIRWLGVRYGRYGLGLVWKTQSIAPSQTLSSASTSSLVLYSSLSLSRSVWQNLYSMTSSVPEALPELDSLKCIPQARIRQALRRKVSSNNELITIAAVHRLDAVESMELHGWVRPLIVCPRSVVS